MIRSCSISQQSSSLVRLEGGVAKLVKSFGHPQIAESLDDFRCVGHSNERRDFYESNGLTLPALPRQPVSETAASCGAFPG